MFKIERSLKDRTFACACQFLGYGLISKKSFDAFKIYKDKRPTQFSPNYVAELEEYAREVWPELFSAA